MNDAFLPYLPAVVSLMIFVGIPLFFYLFRSRLVLREDVEGMVKAERELRETAIKGVTDAMGALSHSVTALHTDHQVLKERLSFLPTREQVSDLAVGQARMMGLLEGRLKQVDHVQDAVVRLDGMVADAARSARQSGG